MPNNFFSQRRLCNKNALRAMVSMVSAWQCVTMSHVAVVACVYDFAHACNVVIHILRTTATSSDSGERIKDATLFCNVRKRNDVTSTGTIYHLCAACVLLYGL